MKRFVIKLIIFLLPVALLFLPPSIALISSGENFRDIEELFEDDGKYLVGYAYNENNYNYFKWKALQSLPRNEVVAVGSSRVLQFRSDMFTTSFYNAGYTVTSAADYLPFLQSIAKDKLPQYLIINLDQWMFNKAWDNLENRKTAENWSNSFTKTASASTYMTVYEDLFQQKYPIYISNSEGNVKRIGLNANVNNKGFRNDGSMYYGTQIDKLLNNDPTALDYDFSDTFDRISKGAKRFEYGDTLNIEVLPEIGKLLNYCKKNNIYVVAIIPPFADAVNNKMAASGKYKYVDEIYSRTKPVFDKYNFELYDFTALNSFGSNDNEVLDGFHGGEVTYIKMLIKMLEQNSKLIETTNVNKLQSDLKAAKNRYIVYK